MIASRVRKITKRFKNSVEFGLAAVMLLSQFAFTFGTIVTATPVSAVGSITATDHEGQEKPGGTWTNGNVTQYAELDSVPFRFTLASDSAASGQMAVRYTGIETTGQACTFFQPVFYLDGIDNFSGNVPAVTTNGSPTQDGDRWVQLLDVTFAGAGSGRVNYTLELTDNAGDCGGSSQSSRLADVAGDFANIGNQNVPIPANQILELPNVTITKYFDDQVPGAGWRVATTGEAGFALDGGDFIPTDLYGQVTFESVAIGPHTISEDLIDGFQFQEAAFDCVNEVVDGVWAFTVEPTTDATDLTCGFVNAPAPPELPTITIIKQVINDNGGEMQPEDFLMVVEANNPSDNNFPGSSDGVTITVEPGEFDINETTDPPTPNLLGAPGYGTDTVGDCSGVIAMGENLTCTLVNDDYPALIEFQKQFIFDDGGYAEEDEFTPVLNGEPVDDWYEFVPIDANTPVEITEESDRDDFTLAEINCSKRYMAPNEQYVPVDYPFTTEFAHHYLCILVNDDLPKTTVTLVKTFADDDAPVLSADDFDLILGDMIVASGQVSDVVPGNPYAVDEIPENGYQFVGITGDDQCPTALGDTVILNEGEQITCYITNDYQEPLLTLVKDFVPGDDGDPQEWTLTATPANGDVISGNGDPNTPGGVQAEIALAGVPYTLSELGPADYDSYSLNCEGGGNLEGVVLTLSAGDNVTCTFVNDHLAGTIIVNKTIINDDGGGATLDDFNLKVNSYNVESGEENTFVEGLYTISEDMLYAGYERTEFYCLDDAGANVGTQFFLSNGSTITCQITNDDKPAMVYVNKVVRNYYGGTADSSDFLLFVGNTLVQDQQWNTFDPGQYRVSEIALVDGYRQDTLRCYQNSRYVGADFHLRLGDRVDCVIINVDIPAKIKVYKQVVNDDGGSLRYYHFPLYINTSRVYHGNTNYVRGNAQYYVTEQERSGYEHTGTSCYDVTAQRPLPNPFIADLGHEIRCTVNNDDIAPTLTINKRVINDNGGDARPDDFSFRLKDFWYSTIETLDNGEEYTGRANKTYRIAENMVDGYEFVRIVGHEACPDNLYDRFWLPLGEDVQCTIVNDDIPPEVTIVKHTHPLLHPQDFEFEIRNNERSTNFTLDTDIFDGQYDWYQHYDNLQAGGVAIQEFPVEDWQLENIACYRIEGLLKYLGDGIEFGDWIPEPFIETDSDSGVRFRVDIGDRVLCIFTNQGFGDLEVVKFHDLNENGEFDEGEPTLDDWSMELYAAGHEDDNGDENGPKEALRFGHPPTYLYDTETTDEEGVADFGTLEANIYYVDEELKEGWRQTAAYCDSEQDLPEQDVEARLGGEIVKPPMQDPTGTHVWVGVGQEVTCYIGNTSTETELLLTKTNDQTEAGQVGDTVVFTLTVTNPETSGVVEKGAVLDVLQDGLTYTGFWSAVSNIRGDIAGSPTIDPGYSSPGEWVIGQLLPGEIVTLTYSAIIQDIVDGTYPDTAFAFGADNFRRQIVYANCGVDNVKCLKEEAQPFVGTEVAVDTPADTPERGFVLGTLVDTGVAAVLPSAIGALIAGIALTLTKGGSKRKRNFMKFWAKMTSALLVGLVGFALFGAVFAPATYAEEENGEDFSFWTFVVSEPEANQEDMTVNVDYEVASTDFGDNYDVELFVDGISEEVQSVPDANASGTFDVTLPDDLVHTIKLVATNLGFGNEMKEGPLVAVSFDNTAPGAPTFDESSSDNRDYTVTFTAPDDADVALIQIFATSDPDNFVLDEASLVGTVPTTPGQTQSFDYTAPDDDQRYFAVVALDSAGNISEPAGEELVVIQAVDTTGLTPSVDDGAEVLGTDEDGEVLEGDINGDGVVDEKDKVDGEDDDNDNLVWIILSILIAAGLIYWINNYQRSAEE